MLVEDKLRLGLHNWYISRVRFLGVSAADKREVPTANYKVYYDKKAMVGGNETAWECVVYELSAEKYGLSQVDSVRKGLGTP